MVLLQMVSFWNPLCTNIIEKVNDYFHQLKPEFSRYPTSQRKTWFPVKGESAMTQVPLETDLDRLSRSPLSEEVTFLIARVSSLANAKANASLRELGLKVRSYSVLNLAASDLNPTQRELAHMLSLDPSQIVALVDELENAGLILREQDPRDRRQKVITATVEGEALLAEARERTQAAQAESLAPLTPEEQLAFRETMLRLAFNE